MKITTAKEMRNIDRATTERFGVPSLTLTVIAQNDRPVLPRLFTMI
ncbi:MAG: hypothetical protein ABSD13_19555 [Candidatus Korobacteraceae bacterium]|jgi:hypothetical protein